MKASRVFSSIQMQIFVAIFVMILVPSLVAGYLAFSKTSAVLEGNLYTERQTQGERSAERLDQYLTDNRAAISALAKNPTVRDMGSPAQQATMKAFQEGLGSFELIFVVDASGMMKNTYPYTRFGGKVDFTDRQWYKDVVRDKATVISDTYISAFTNQATAPIVAPVRDANGVIIGYIGGNLSLGNLNGLVSPLNHGDSGKGIVLDKHSFYLVDSRDEAQGKKHVAFRDDKLTGILQAGKAQTKLVDDRVVSYVPVGATGWAVLSLQPVQEFLRPAQIVRRHIILSIARAIILVSIVIGAIGFYAIRRRIVRPVAQLGAAAQSIARGDLRHCQMCDPGSNELGVLAEAFASMTQGIRDIVRQVSEIANVISGYGSQLMLSAENSTRVANQVVGSFGTIADGVNAQAGSIDQTTGAIKEIAGTIDALAAQSESVAVISAQAAEAAQTGTGLIDSIIAEMQTVKDTVASSTEIIQRLGDDSKQINQIIETIAAIAGQTNLLALNAAIEAARAGEQGRGFAVVADEVRKLASQSSAAASKITAIVGEIQTDTEQAVRAVSQGIYAVNAGTESVSSAGQAFSNIAALNHAVHEKIQEMTQEVRGISYSGKQIAATADTMDVFGRKVAGQTQTVSQATEEHLAAFEAVAALSRQMAVTAEKLQATVAKFKI